MKIDFNIFQSIIFGELRPWLNNLQKDENKKILDQFEKKESFQNRNELTNEINKIYTSNSLISKSNTFRIELFPEFDKSQKQYPDIFDHLIYLPIPLETSKLSDYYYSLIYVSSLNLISEILDALNYFDLKTAEYPVIRFTEQIDHYLTETEKQIKLHDKNTELIFSFLATMLAKTKFELQSLYPSFFKSTINFENELKKYQATQTYITSKLNKILITGLISVKSIDIENVTELIEKSRVDYIRFVESKFPDKKSIDENEEHITNIRTLENIVCLHKLDYLKGNQNISTQIEPQKLNGIKNEYQNQIITELEKIESPANRISLINNELEKFAFLNSNHRIENPKLELSLPRELRTWLNKIEEVYKVNPNYIPSDLKENPKLKTHLSVPELAYLFKSLYDLKPNIFDVKVNADLYRFISNNFITKGSDEISTNKLKNLFNDPDDNAVEFWKTHFSTLLHNSRNIN